MSDTIVMYLVSSPYTPLDKCCLSQSSRTQYNCYMTEFEIERDLQDSVGDVFYAVGRGFVAMFPRINRYLLPGVPGSIQISSLSYSTSWILEQLIAFTIPAFQFVSGFIVAVATGRGRDTIVWSGPDGIADPLPRLDMCHAGIPGCSGRPGSLAPAIIPEYIHKRLFQFFSV